VAKQPKNESSLVHQRPVQGKERVWVDAKTCWLCFGSTLSFSAAPWNLLQSVEATKSMEFLFPSWPLEPKVFSTPSHEKKRNFLTLKQEGELDLGG
jgi:hypothetical protein